MCLLSQSGAKQLRHWLGAPGQNVGSGTSPPQTITSATDLAHRNPACDVQACGVDVDGVAELLQLLDQPVGAGFLVAFAQPLLAEVLIGLVAFDYVIGVTRIE